RAPLRPRGHRRPAAGRRAGGQARRQVRVLERRRPGHRLGRRPSTGGGGVRLMVKVAVINPGSKVVEVSSVEPTLENFKPLVGGWLEMLYLAGDLRAYINE